MMAATAVRRVRVSRRIMEADDIVGLDLVDPNGHALPPFAAGAHIDLHLPGGFVRQYSLCNDSSERHRYRIAVLRDAHSRGGSLAVHALETGAEVDISDPRNHFPLAHDATDSVLFAGGIGITPILCMAARLANINASFRLHYCTRSPSRTAFLGTIRDGDLGAYTRFHFDDGPAEQKLDMPGSIGVPGQGRHLYVCGPTGFMERVLEVARNLGWPEERLHREYFAATPIESEQDGSFEVQIASTGRVIAVAAQQSVVEALAASGIDIPTSCEQGVCGTCLVRVLEGTPDHRDMYLTAQEHARGDQFTPCCSRARSARLVLDL